MKTASRILFYEGLILVVFGLLSFVFTGINFYSVFLGGLGLLCLVVGFALDYSGLLDSFGRRSTKYGANALVYSLVFIGILGFINVLAANHNKKIDMTKAGVNTLTDQTQTVIKNLPGPTEIVAFFKAGESREFERLAKLYADVSDKISYTVIDPDLRPEVVQQYAVTERGAVAISCEGRTSITLDATEQGLTLALMKVSSAAQGNVYILEGHGELPLEDRDVRGMAFLKEGLENENIVIKTLNIPTAGQIPDDANLIIVAGPTNPLSETEASLLSAFLDQGGRLLLLIDPLTDHGLGGLLAKYGIVPQNDLIVEKQLRLFQDPAPGFDPVVVDYGFHEITKKMQQNITLFHLAQSLKTETDGQSEGVIVDPILKTRAESWGEIDLDSFKEGETPENDPERDSQGPLTLGVAAERTIGEGKQQTSARLVVIGDSDFASNRYIGEYFNGNLFLNIVNWLTGKEEYISIRANTFAPDVFSLNDKDRSVIFFASVFLFPQLVIMLGIGVALRRKR